MKPLYDAKTLAAFYDVPIVKFEDNEWTSWDVAAWVEDTIPATKIVTNIEDLAHYQRLGLNIGETIKVIFQFQSVEDAALFVLRWSDDLIAM